MHIDHANRHYRRAGELNKDVGEKTARDLRILADCVHKNWYGMIVDGLAIVDALRELALVREGRRFVTLDECEPGADHADVLRAASTPLKVKDPADAD